MIGRPRDHAPRTPLAVLCACTCALLGAAADPGRSLDTLPDRPAVTTLAGSGAMGIADGSAANASFVAPAAVTYDASGNLYVADREAQRIRVVAPDGSVRTIAGSGMLYPFASGTGGGYSDGSAEQAQFNMPEGLLALPDGSLLVADTKNYCLRLVKNGTVSTFTGNHSDYRGADGTLATARFTTPRSLAMTPDGTIFVADPPNGVRKIAGNNVTTLRFPDSGAVVALTSIQGMPDLIAVATATKIEVIDVRSASVTATVGLESGFVNVAPREGGRPFGPPSAIAAFSPTEFVTTDPLASAVRLLQIDKPLGNTYTRVLTQTPNENAAYGAAGFRDGPGESALVDEPMGLAISSMGEIAVADTGNRRIRLLAPFNHTTHVTVELAGGELPAAPDASEYRIALVGNSYTWFDQAWHESIGGMLQDDLSAKHVAAPRTPRVYPVMRLGLPTLDALDLIDNELADGVVDAVVLDVSTYGENFGAADVPHEFGPAQYLALTKALDVTAQALAASNVAFFVVVHPGAGDFPDEFAYRRMPKGPPIQSGDTVERRDPYAIELYHDQMADALAKSGLPIVDLWPPFLQAYDATDRVPLFESWDHHFSPAGRRILADGIARAVSSNLRSSKPK